ncbi:MAG TPA: hypothetical protein VGW75_06920 [Solirubrobacteraceae bacterium]|jgi:hypothetical protein|nr:hypothetical protein [Solirubrobacteraceae bacterium]
MRIFRRKRTYVVLALLSVASGSTSFLLAKLGAGVGWYYATAFLLIAVAVKQAVLPETALLPRRPPAPPREPTA